MPKRLVLVGKMKRGKAIAEVETYFLLGERYGTSRTLPTGRKDRVRIQSLTTPPDRVNGTIH